MAAGDFTRAMGTPICWADETDYDDTVSGIARTNQIDLTGLAATDAWQGAKVDLGATRPPAYAVKICVEIDVNPAAGGAVELYWSSSCSGTPATGNDGGVESTGADSDWDGVAGGAAAERGEYKNHLIFIGQLGVGADADVLMVKTVNPYFVPPTRYGFPILFNNSSQAFHGDADEMYIALIPILENVAAS